MTTETKYCTDCKFFQPSDSFKDENRIKFGLCLRYTEAKDGNYWMIDPSLNKALKPHFASTARCESMCGEVARSFEEKEQPLAGDPQPIVEEEAND